MSGINGSGKTTLFNIISGKLEPDTGKVEINGEVTYIKQFEEISEAFKPSLNKQAFMPNLNNTHSQSEWQAYNTHLTSSNGRLIEEEFSNLSGGEKTKYRINKKIRSNIDDILLADEPSNHLDIAETEKLEEKLKKYQGTLLLISHDRNLLDKVCDTILEIENGKVTKYNGNYTFYKTQKEQETSRKEFEYTKYVEEKNRLEKSINVSRSNTKSMKKAPTRMGNSEARLHKRETEGIKEKLERHSKAMQTRLDQLEEKEKPQRQIPIYMKVDENNSLKSRFAITGEKINIQCGKKEIFKEMSFRLLSNKKTALIGGNGSGKTTLIKEIVKRNNSIVIKDEVKLGYFSQELENLDNDKTILENVLQSSIQSEIVCRNILGRLLFKDKDVFKKVEVLSGGERVKVALAKILVSDANVLLLDEPTNFLDLQSLESLESLINEYIGTIVFISHDRMFIDKVATNLLIIEDKKLIEFEGNYTEYLNNKVTKKEDKKTNQNSLLIDMKLASIINRISSTNNEQEREKLEKEYQELLEQKRICALERNVKNAKNLF